MAEVLVGPETVTVRLTRAQRWAALHGDLTVPRSAVRGVTVVERPFDHLRGLRLPGTCLPRRLALGTWRNREVRDFVAVRYRQPAVVIDLDPATADGWTRLLVSVDDAEAVSRELGALEPRRVRPLTAPRS